MVKESEFIYNIFYPNGRNKISLTEVFIKEIDIVNGKWEIEFYQTGIN